MRTTLIWLARGASIAEALVVRDGSTTDLRAVTNSGRQKMRVFCQALGIRWWKDHIPEAGAFCPGGFPKRRLESDDPAYLRLFALEASRAELSHCLTWSLALTFFAWTPWPIAVFMVCFGALGNGPCILVQRYNRIRLNRALRTLERRAHRNRAALPRHAVAHQGEIQ